MKSFHHLLELAGQIVASILMTLLFLSVLSVPATADLITWNLNNVTFANQGGGPSLGGASGWFQYDNTAGQITNWNITTPQIADLVQGAFPTYTPINPQPFTFTPTASSIVPGHIAPASASIVQSINNVTGLGPLNNFSILTFTGYSYQQWSAANVQVPIGALESNMLSFAIYLPVPLTYDGHTPPPNLTPLGTIPIITAFGPPGGLSSSILGLGQADGQVNYTISAGQLVSANQASPVPLPDTLFLLASGFASLIGLKRKYLG